MPLMGLVLFLGVVLGHMNERLEKVEKEDMKKPAQVEVQK